MLVPKGWVLSRVGGRRLSLCQGPMGSHHVQRCAMPPKGIEGWENSLPAALAPGVWPCSLAASPGTAQAPLLQKRCCNPQEHGQREMGTIHWKEAR